MNLRRKELMAAVKELLRAEADGALGFGDYTLSSKTKLEKNGMFVYESVPGTAVEDFKASEREVSFKVSGTEDAQITLELEADSEYVVYMDDVNVGDMTTNLSGKLSVSAELDPNKEIEIKIIKK